jgi:hypothetical protein
MSREDMMKQFLEGPKKGKRKYAPGKADLSDILNDILRYCEPLEAKDAKDEYNSAKKARREYERSDPEWMRLRRAERRAKDAMWRIKEESEARQRQEAKDCRNLLRLDGPTPAVVARIRKLVMDNSPVSGEDE